jgi:hypothetical protein
MRSRVTYIRQCWAYKTDLAADYKSGSKMSHISGNVHLVFSHKINTTGCIKKKLHRFEIALKFAKQLLVSSF